MSETVIHVDEERAAALEAAVSAGGAEIGASRCGERRGRVACRSGAEVDPALLRQLWQEGIDSGEPRELDIKAFLKELRRGDSRS